MTSEIPTRALLVSLLLGVVVRTGSYLDLSKQTRRRRWRHLINWTKPISHDSFEYVSQRFNLEDLRQSLAQANKTLESCKINGLLWASLDANEHFQSRSRCCPCCCQRQIEETDPKGDKQTVIEYYHRYVFAQINGPKINALLDLEPIKSGEGEAQAALRLPGRMRRVYGPRFFDALTIDSWYVQSPFLKAVDKLGCAWAVVLNQEPMEVFQEARQLSQGKKPDREFYDAQRDRQVQLWEIKDLTFSKACGRPVWAGPNANLDVGLSALRRLCRIAQPASAPGSDEPQRARPRPGFSLGGRLALGAMVCQWIGPPRGSALGTMFFSSLPTQKRTDKDHGGSVVLTRPRCQKKSAAKR
jgi:hypothetical protein